jgi:hypothetical protein
MAGWDSFYVIVGSAGAALIGIQFVVVTLIAGMPRRPNEEAFEAFANPTVLHFTSSLIISAIVESPWPSQQMLAIALAFAGGLGVVYEGMGIGRIRRQHDYQTVWQDWVWYVVVPTSAYLSIVAAALILRTYPRSASFAVAAATLTLLLAGIHNSWDSVMHLIINRPYDTKPGDDKRQDKGQDRGH